MILDHQLNVVSSILHLQKTIVENLLYHAERLPLTAYRLAWTTICYGLDQLYFSKLIPGETEKDRAQAIDRYIELNGWTWDQVVEEISKENDRVQTSKRKSVC